MVPVLCFIIPERGAGFNENGKNSITGKTVFRIESFCGKRSLASSLKYKEAKIMRRLLAALITMALTISTACAGHVEIGDNEKNAIVLRKTELEEKLGSMDQLQVYVYEPENPPEPLAEDASTEDKFLADFVAALEARWKLTSNTPSKLTDKQRKNIKCKYVQVELDHLEQYETVTMADPWLNLLAHAYIKGLRNQSRAINEFYDKSDVLFSEYWTAKGSNLRALAIYLITQYYHPKVNSKYRDTMEEISFTGYMLALGDPVSDLISFMNETTETGNVIPTENPFEISLEAIDLRYSFVTARLLLKNISDETISEISLVICFTDKEGNILDTAYTNRPERLRPGLSNAFDALCEKKLEPYAFYVDRITYLTADGTKKEVFLDMNETYLIDDAPKAELEPTAVPPTAEPVIDHTAAPETELTPEHTQTPVPDPTPTPTAALTPEHIKSSE